MATKVITRRDAEIEQILNEHLDARNGKPRWTYVEAYAVDDIERKGDAQSRISPVNKASVSMIAEKMKQGTTFPPVILWETDDNGVLLIDGNHRALGCVKAKKDSTPAYIVHLDNIDEAVYLSAVFNGQHGNPLTKDEIRRAVLSARRQGVTDARIARDFGVARGTVANITGTAEATDRATRLGVTVDGLSRTHLASLNKIEMDRPFAAAARLAQQAALSTGATSALVKAVAAAPKSEADQIAVIEAERDARQDDIASVSIGRKVAGSPFTDLRTVLNSTARVRESYPEVAAWVPREPATARAWVSQVEDFAEFMRDLAEAYRAAAV
jgi:ParB-like chromosome segregation protein Spo0J